MSFISGPYRWTFAGESLGITETAPLLRYTQNGVPIIADAAGGLPIDAIFTGLTGFMGFTFQEWDADGIQELLARPGGQIGQYTNIGCPFIDAQADVLIGTRIPFAACVSPDIFIAYRASVVPNQEIELAFGGSELRRVPIVLQLYPYARPETVHIFELIENIDDMPEDVTKSGATSLATYITGLA